MKELQRELAAGFRNIYKTWCEPITKAAIDIRWNFRYGRVVRTTISIGDTIYESGLERLGKFKPPYKNFSDYVESLIQQDVSRGGPHTFVREEPEKIRVLRASHPVKYSGKKKAAAARRGSAPRRQSGAGAVQ